MARMVLVFVDCEAYGGCPALGAMTEIGAVTYPDKRTFHGISRVLCLSRSGSPCRGRRFIWSGIFPMTSSTR